MCELGITVAVLIICSYFDIKSKRIPFTVVITMILFIVADTIIHCAIGDFHSILLSRLIGIVPGAFLLILSLITNEKVGKGDGLLLLLFGLFIGVKKVFLILCIGLFLQSIVACFLLILHKADKQTLIPFVPFLMIGSLVIFVYYIL